MDVRGTGCVNMDEFATWFKYRTGDDEPEIPVLPEYLVRKVGTLSARIKMGQAMQDHSSEQAAKRGPVGKTEPEVGKQRDGKELWGFLAPRLGVLVTLQHQWGR